MGGTAARIAAVTVAPTARMQGVSVRVRPTPFHLHGGDNLTVPAPIKHVRSLLERNIVFNPANAYRRA